MTELLLTASSFQDLVACFHRSAHICAGETMAATGRKTEENKERRFPVIAGNTETAKCLSSSGMNRFACETISFQWRQTCRSHVRDTINVAFAQLVPMVPITLAFRSLTNCILLLIQGDRVKICRRIVSPYSCSISIQFNICNIPLLRQPDNVDFAFKAL